MIKLTKFLENLFKIDGFVLVDANENEYVIGKPFKNPPIKLKLLDKSLHYKLLLLPDLYFGEAYTNGSAVIENGSLTDFLEIAMKNIGRGPISNYMIFFWIKIGSIHVLILKTKMIHWRKHKKIK